MLCLLSIHAAFACETISTALQLCKMWVAIPTLVLSRISLRIFVFFFFFAVSSPVLCKLLLWQHVALVFMAGWPLRSVPIRLMTLGPRPGMMMMVLVIISYEYRYLLLLLLLTQLPLAVIDHQSAGIVSTLYLGTLGRGVGEPEEAKGISYTNT